MKDNSRVECNGGTDDEPSTLEVLVSMPDKKVNKLYHFNIHDKVWTAKLQVINELVKGVKDVLNYGFYDPPCNGKSGKFLEEERPFMDYPLKGSPPVLEFKCKRRVYRSLVYEPKALQKVNSKVNQRKFMELVCSNAVGQVAKMTEKGMDPNFQDDKNGETPLSIAVTKENASDMLIILVNGGALLDYRTRDGMTPVHKAAASGQAGSVKTLLDFGASPNYKDSKGLTPLFYSVLNGGDPYCCEILLNDHSEVHISDHQGMQEIHLACKNGLVQHLEHLLFYGAEIDARTASGNTALHVAALNNQDACARVLMFRGAKKNILNYANQSAYEVAAVSGNKDLAELISNFTDKDIVKLSGKPTYSTRRRKSVSKPKASSLFPRTSSESQLSVNSDTTPPSPVSSTLSIPSTTASDTASIDEHITTMNGELETHRYLENRNSRTLSVSSTASDTSDSDSGELSPREEKGKHRTWRHAVPDSTSSVPPVKVVSGAATIRKRLYASVPGKRFTAIRDYRPFTAGELALQLGDEVEVLYVGEKGFWEGRVGTSTGWFHHSCVEEKKKGKQRAKPPLARPPSVSSLSSSDTNGVSHLDLNNNASRTVTLQRTDAGFGFQMRGANSQVPRLNFEPTPEFPALQYFGELEKNGEAELKGVKAGDFILEVNGEDVTTATHGHVVDLIKKGGNSVTLKIITVKSKTPSTNGTDHTDGHGFKLPPPPPDRDPSTTLTLGRLSRLSSSRPSLFEMSDSSYEELPSYGVDSIIAVSKENRWHSLQRQKPHGRKPVGIQMKGQNSAKRKSASEVNSGKTAYQRAQSMHNIMPPPYESIVGRRPVSAAVPVAIPHVPSDPRFSRSVSEDNAAFSKYAPTSKSTPNLDKVNGDDIQNGPSSSPKDVVLRKDAKRNMAYNRPFSYVEPNTYKSRTASPTDNETVVATPVKAAVVAVEASDRNPEMTVVATPVEVVEASAEVTSNTPKSEKPPVPPKPRTLSDALQEAVAARTERINQRGTDTEIEPVQRSRKSSAPESDARASFQPTEFRDRKMSAPAKFNPRKKLEASDMVRSKIMTSLEENFTEDESNGEKSPVKVMEKGKFDLGEQKFTASSADIYRRYTNSTSPIRDMNRQQSLDSSEAGRQMGSTASGKLGRQLSEPVDFDRNLSPHVPPKPLNTSAPTAPPPPQIQLSDRVNSSRGAAPPPPPVFIPSTSKTNIPNTTVSQGLITADALAAKKLNLKCAPNDKGADTTVRKHSAPANGDSRNFAVEHGSLLAKAVAERAARISAQSHSGTGLSAAAQSSQQANNTGNERQPSSPGKSNNSALAQLVEARAVNSRGKPSPPVAPKKRLSSPDLRHRKQGADAGRSLPFDIPAPVLSEEDKSVMMLDEVIRREAESENWSLNSWNSGSDSSSEVFVPPPVWPSEHHDHVENASRPWCDCSSPSEESIVKAPEPEKFNKTITTKKGFKIQLTFETKKEETPKSPTEGSPRTDYNEIDPVVPLKPKSTDATDGTNIPKETLVKSEVISEEKDTDQVKTDTVTNKPSNRDTNFGLPPPPLLFTDTDEPYPLLDSPPLPPPPEFSPRGPKPSELVYHGEDDDSSSLPSSARSDESEKGAIGYTDISSIFSGYARPMEAFMDKAVLDWDCDDVCNWLDSIKMPQYKETFRENDIQGAHLPDLTKTELKELGVKSLGHRMTLENAIAKLSQPLESNC